MVLADAPNTSVPVRDQEGSDVHEKRNGWKRLFTHTSKENDLHAGGAIDQSGGAGNAGNLKTVVSNGGGDAI